MSQAQLEAEVPHEEHASPKTYVQIAVLLTIITALEVGTYYSEWLNRPENHRALVLLLVVMSSAKFFTVVGWYMHLKYDARIFRRLFLAGLTLAAVILSVLVALFTYHPMNYLLG
jgi:cytochrome c oxidase subunit 4